MPKFTQKQVIEAIKELKSIKPRQEWAILLKSQILSPEPEPQKARELPAQKISFWQIMQTVLFQKKLAYAFAAFIFVITGMFGFAQYTVPGDLLFPVKKLAEQQFQSPLVIAVNRSNDVLQVAKEKKDVYPAISELKASLADAAKNLAQSIAQAGKDSIRQIAADVKKIEDNKKQLQTLGIDIDSTQETKDLDNALAPLVQAEIVDLEKAILADEQKAQLALAEELYGQQKYSEALEIILTITN